MDVKIENKTERKEVMDKKRVKRIKQYLKKRRKRDEKDKFNQAGEKY